MDYDLNTVGHTVDRLAQDMWLGNGKPGVTTRLEKLEDHKKMTEADLYDDGDGLVPQMRKFFIVSEERARQAKDRDRDVKETLLDTDRRKSRRIALYAVLVAAVTVFAMPAWDIIKHYTGWFK